MIRIIFISFIFLFSSHVYSHRLNPQVLKTDNEIQESLTSVFESKFGNKQKIYVSSYNYRVLLFGDVTNQDVKGEVETLSKQDSKVKRVVNLLNVVNIIPTTNPQLDKEIFDNINKTLSTNVVYFSLKINVFNGNVFLQGVLTKSESDSISNQVSKMNGVKSVYKIFDIVKDDDIKRLDSFGIN